MPLPKSEDSVRVYLRQIGRVPLLTASAEIEIGRRIEAENASSCSKRWPRCRTGSNSS